MANIQISDILKELFRNGKVLEVIIASGATPESLHLGSLASLLFHIPEAKPLIGILFFKRADTEEFNKQLKISLIEALLERLERDFVELLANSFVRSTIDEYYRTNDCNPNSSKLQHVLQNIPEVSGLLDNIERRYRGRGFLSDERIDYTWDTTLNSLVDDHRTWNESSPTVQPSALPSRYLETLMESVNGDIHPIVAVAASDSNRNEHVTSSLTESSESVSISTFSGEAEENDNHIQSESVQEKAVSESFSEVSRQKTHVGFRRVIARPSPRLGNTTKLSRAHSHQVGAERIYKILCQLARKRRIISCQWAKKN